MALCTFLLGSQASTHGHGEEGYQQVSTPARMRCMMLFLQPDLGFGVSRETHFGDRAWVRFVSNGRLMMENYIFQNGEDSKLSPIAP